MNIPSGSFIPRELLSNQPTSDADTHSYQLEGTFQTGSNGLEQLPPPMDVVLPAENPEDFSSPTFDYRGFEAVLSVEFATNDSYEEFQSLLGNSAELPLVGIIDTEFDLTNAGLADTSFYLGYDWVDNDQNPLAENPEIPSHGTQVLQAIAGDSSPAETSAVPSIWLGRAVGSGEWSDSLMEFVDTAVALEKSAAIANLSFDLTEQQADGIFTPRDELTANELAALSYAQQNGIIVVVAAGNDNAPLSALAQAAGQFDNIVTVGAASADSRADYSNYGDDLTLVADIAESDTPGTSLAAAEVTQALQTVWQQSPELNYRQVIESLTQTATDLQQPGWDADTGYGQLNLEEALEVAAQMLPEPLTPSVASSVEATSLVEPLPTAASVERSLALEVATVIPANGADDIDPRAPIRIQFANEAVDASTLNRTTFQLLDDNNQVVNATVGSDSTGGVISLTPLSPLDPFTEYTVVITDDLQTTDGDAATPFSATFTTGDTSAGEGEGLRFDSQQVVAGESRFGVSSIAIGPDEHVYASDITGNIVRYNIDPATGQATGTDTVFAQDGAQIVGIAFDPDATATDLKLWITYAERVTDPNTGERDLFSSKVAQLTIPADGGQATKQDYIVGLPNTQFLQHQANGLNFGPDGKLYQAVGGVATLGGTPNWDADESPLSSAIIVADVNSPDFPTNQTGQPVDVQTVGLESDNDPNTENYDPTASDAPVQVFATGFRNSYDLAWHSNGNLYAGINQNSLGGSTRTPNDPDGPATAINAQPDEVLALVREGNYYGHPNPSRDEYVLNGGNPTSDRDKWEVSQYPVGVEPEENFDPTLFYNTGAIGGNSPNGLAEYTAEGPLNGRLLVSFFTSSRTIQSFEFGSDGLVSATDALQDANGNPLRFKSPLDVAVHPNGRIYVADFGNQQGDPSDGSVWVLNPIEAPVTPPPTPPSDGSFEIEAEDFDSFDNYRVESRPGLASGDQVIQNSGSDGAVGTAQVAFSGPTGLYDIEVVTFDENDGESPMRVLVNGEPISNDAVWVMNEQLGSNAVSDGNRVTRLVGRDVSLTADDVITLEGTKADGEFARFDLIRFIPMDTVTPPTTESGTVQFTDSSFAVDEDGTPVNAVTVERVGGTDGEVSVTVTPTADSADTPADFDASPITVTFADGDDTPQTVAVPVVDDGTVEADETVQLTLTGDEVAGQTTATLTILDDDEDIVDPPDGSTGDPFEIEAEDFESLVNYQVEDQPGVASGGQVLQNLSNNGTVASAQLAFPGPVGTYDVEVVVFDENDGASPMRVLLNGQPLSDEAVWTMDESLSGSSVTDGNRVTRVIGRDISLTSTDVITLEGTRNEGELARFDLIRFTPKGTVTPPPTTESGTVQFTDSSFAVGEDGTPVNAVTVERVGGTDGEVSVTVTPIADSADTPADFDASPITVTFADGDDTPQTVAIPIVDDGNVEADETLQLTLTGDDASGQTQATLTIVDDDDGPVDPPSGPSGDPFEIEAEAFDSFVNYRVETGRKAASGDQVIRNNGSDGAVGTAQLAFPGPTGTYDVEVVVFDENDGESQMRVLLNGEPLSDEAVWTMDQQLGSNATASRNRVTRLVGSGVSLSATDVITLEGTKADGEFARFDLIRFTPKGTVTPPTTESGTVQFTDSSFAVDEDGTPVNAVTVERVGGTDGEVSVTVTPTADSADTPADFDASPITVTFADGDDTPQTVAVPIVDDGNVEADETVQLTLTGDDAAGQTTATLTIVDDDAPFNPPGGHSGDPFEIEAEDFKSLVNYQVEDQPGVASGGQILQNLNNNGTVAAAEMTFPGPVGTYDVEVVVFDENDGESPMRVLLNGQPLSDEAVWTMDESLSGSSVTDGNRVTRVVGRDISLTSTDVITLEGTRHEGELARFDLIRFTPKGTVTPPSESGTVQFTDSSFAVDEDGTPVNAVTVERVGGTDGEVSVTVTPTADSADTPADFDASPITVTFADGDDTPQTVVIPVVDDGDVEADETVQLTLTGDDAAGQTTATLTIVDDDAVDPPGGSDGDPFEIEAEDFDSFDNYRVENRPGLASGDQVIQNTGNNGTVGTAQLTFSGPAGLYDLEVVTFDENDGESPMRVLVNGEPISNDAVWVMNERLGSNAVSDGNRVTRLVGRDVSLTADDVITLEGTKADGEFARFDLIRFIPMGTVTPPPTESGTVQFTDSSFAVGEDGTPVNAVTLERVGGTNGEVSVTVTPTANSAETPADFDASPITVTFADGDDTPQTVAIPVVDDAIAEADETVALGLSGDSDVLGNRTTATLTIQDNDDGGDIAGVMLQASGSSTTVSEAGMTDSYEISLSSRPTDTVTIEITHDPSQVTLNRDRLTFTPDNWDQPQSVEISAIDDNQREGAHTTVLTHTAKSAAGSPYDDILIDFLTVDITDNEAGGKALLIAGSRNLSGSDRTARTLLEEEGFEVTVVEGAASRASDAVGQDLIAISQSVTSTDVGNKFTDVDVPIVVWESYLLDDLGMANRYGTTTGNSVTLTNSSHTLSADLDLGNTAIYPNSDTVGWGDPSNNNAISIAHTGDPNQLAIFGYEAGDRMDVGTAPARRVAANFWDTPTADGEALFVAAIDWATGQAPTTPGGDPGNPPDGEDTVPPTATQLTDQLSSTAGSDEAIGVAVRYSDAGGIDLSSLGVEDITVSNGQTTLAVERFVVSPDDRTVTYFVKPPSQGWQVGNSDDYVVKLVASEVADEAGNFAEAKTLGSFALTVTPETDPGPGPSTPLGSRSVTMGGGGFVTDVHLHPKEKDLAYIRTDMGGFYRWDTGNGGHWVPLTESFPQALEQYYGGEALAFDPNNPDVVYIAAGKRLDSSQPGTILKSTDRGETWTKLDIDMRMGGNDTDRWIGERMAVDPNDSQTVLFGSRKDGLWQTKNGGQDWRKVSSLPNPGNNTGIAGILFDPNQDGLVYANSSGKGVYKSTDGGDSWSRISGSSNSVQRMSIAPDGTLYVATESNPKVAKYDPKANRWSDITPDGAWSGAKFGTISVNPHEPNELIASTGETSSPQIFFSKNGGDSWQQIKPKLNNTVPWWDDFMLRLPWISDIEFDPHVPDRVWMTNWYGTWRTDDVDDFSEPWTNFTKGHEQTVPFDMISPPEGPLLVSAMADVDGFYHDDFDTSPSRRLGSVEGTTRFSDSYSIDYAPSQPNRMARVGGNSGKQKYGLAISNDSGRTWHESDAFPSNVQPVELAFSATDPDTIVVVRKDATALYTHNGGDSWKSVQGLPTDLEGRFNWNKPLTADANGNFYYYSSGKLYRSTNDGASFSVVETNLPYDWPYKLKSPQGEANEVWLSAEDRGLYRSTNGGSDFSRISNVEKATMFSFGVAESANDFPYIYLYGTVTGQGEGTYVSKDEGKTWQDIGSPDAVIGNRPVVMEGSWQTPGLVFVGANGRGIYVGQA